MFEGLLSKPKDFLKMFYFLKRSH